MSEQHNFNNIFFFFTEELYLLQLALIYFANNYLFLSDNKGPQVHYNKGNARYLLTNNYFAGEGIILP